MVCIEELNRRKKLEDKRIEILEFTTREQRMEQTQNFVEAISSFGKKHFPSRKLFLDDLRPCPKGFILVKNVEECKYHLETRHVSILSLDHDLGEDEPTGYDLTKWMVENEIWADVIYLHTANPVGRMNMHQLLTRYKPDHVKVHNSPIPNWLLSENE